MDSEMRNGNVSYPWSLVKKKTKQQTNKQQHDRKVLSSRCGAPFFFFVFLLHFVVSGFNVLACSRHKCSSTGGEAHSDFIIFKKYLFRGHSIQISWGTYMYMNQGNLCFPELLRSVTMTIYGITPTLKEIPSHFDCKKKKNDYANSHFD